MFEFVLIPWRNFALTGVRWDSKVTVLTVSVHTTLVQTPLQWNLSPLTHTIWKKTNISIQHFTLITFTLRMCLVYPLNLPTVRQHPNGIQHKISCTYNFMKAERDIQIFPIFIKNNIILQENCLLSRGWEGTIFSSKKREGQVYCYKRKSHDALRTHNDTITFQDPFCWLPHSYKLCSLSASNFSAY